jgi:DNA-binding protein H-NS
MAIDLKSLSPKELQALIAGAHAQMQDARSNMIQDVRKKIDALLNLSGLTLAEVYPTRGGKIKSGKKGIGSVAPKYRNPSNPSEAWSGRGRQPLWFAEAIKKRGVTAENLLIGGAPKATPPAKVSKKTAKKPARKKVAKG